jgi:secreted trypsin-like serine protease
VRRMPSLLLSVLMMALAVATLMTAVIPSAGDAAKRRGHKAKAEVVGGSDVPDGAYPFVVALGTVSATGGIDKFFCGGSLIAPLYVLTAAHCAVGASAGEIAVVVGQTEFGSGQGVQRTVAEIAIHPGFSFRTISNDVAVLTLNEPVQGITPVALIGADDRSFDGGGASLTLVGWGDMVPFPHPGKSGRFPTRLQQLAVSVIPDGNCAKQWKKFGLKRVIVATQTLCTTAHKFGRGDSGSPLFSNAGGAHVQVSLVSGGFAGDRKHNVSDFGPQLSSPGIRGFIASIAGV